MRNKVSIFVLLTGLALAGCGKDSILPNEDPGNNGSGGSTSGVTPTTIEVNYDEEDLIEGTTFVRTISIAFSNEGDATVTGDENGIVTVSGNQVTVETPPPMKRSSTSSPEAPPTVS